jgi:hypothetical protein
MKNSRRKFLKLTSGLLVPAAALGLPGIVRAQVAPRVIFSGRNTATPPAGQSYLLSEKFEGTGTPSGWSPSGTFNFDNTSNPLANAQDLRIASSTSSVDTASWSGQPSLYVAFLLYTSAAPGSLANIGFFMDSSPTSVARLSITSGALTMRALATGGTTSSSTVNALNTTPGAGTPVKMRYTKGTGTNAVVTAWVASGGAWGTGVSSSNGTATADAVFWRFSNTSSYGINLQFDNVIVYDQDINVSDVTGL